MNRIDLLGGLLVGAFGLLMIFVLIPRGTQEGMYYGLPPTFFPTLLASGLTICAGGLVAQSIIRLKRSGKGKPNTISRWNMISFVILVTTILAGMIMIDVFGLVIGAPLLIAALMFILRERNPIRILATSIIPVAAFYYLAIYVLQTPVP